MIDFLHKVFANLPHLSGLRCYARFLSMSWEGIIGSSFRSSLFERSTIVVVMVNILLCPHN